MGNPVQPALILSDVSRTFGRVRALTSISLTIDRGTSTAVMGPNGAGKTTLLKLCSTLLAPTSGAIRINGLDPTTDGATVRAGLATLGHDTHLYGDLSATENLHFFARLHGLRYDSGDIEAILRYVGLQGAARRPLRTYSRGMQQRCAMARVALQRPRLMLLDEPASSLDVGAREVLIEIVQHLRSNGTTVVMTTHEIADSTTLCDEAILLTNGQLSWRGPVDDELGNRLRTLIDDNVKSRMPRLAASGIVPGA